MLIHYLVKLDVSIIYLFIYYQFVHIVQENKRKVTQLLDSLQYS